MEPKAAAAFMEDQNRLSKAKQGPRPPEVGRSLENAGGPKFRPRRTYDKTNKNGGRDGSKVDELEMAKQAQEHKVTNAVVQIQSFFRGFLVRTELLRRAQVSRAEKAAKAAAAEEARRSKGRTGGGGGGAGGEDSTEGLIFAAGRQLMREYPEAFAVPASGKHGILCEDDRDEATGYEGRGVRALAPTDKDGFARFADGPRAMPSGKGFAGAKHAQPAVDVSTDFFGQSHVTKKRREYVYFRLRLPPQND
jgi:hypothetical protein